MGLRESQGNRVEHPENQKWYFTNGEFTFANPPDLHLKMARWGRKQPVFGPGWVFAFETWA